MEKTNSEERSLTGKITGIIGITVNILLAIGKIAVGYIFGLVSVIADGLNNLTDCGSSVVSLVSFKLSAKPADEEHPFGHERIEYICSMSVAFLVLLVAFDTIKESISKIVLPTETVFSVWIIAVLAASLLAKLGLYVFYKITAAKINSSILSASATDSLTDCISTLVTLICFIVSAVTGFNADGYAGIAVSLFIGWSAVNILKDIFSALIGKAPDKQMIDDIKSRILSYNGVISVHDLSVYSYGPNKFFASVHIEVPADVNVLVSHELIDEIERDFAENSNIVLIGHLDPIETDNPEVTTLKAQVEKSLKEIDEKFSIHDFRIVKGEKRTNVLFDVAIPYGSVLSKEQIKEKAETTVKNLNDTYHPVITVEYYS